MRKTGYRGQDRCPEAVPVDPPGGCCSHGVPLASHAKCVACGILIGCQGEVPHARPDKDAAGLCVDCQAEGVRVLVKEKTKKSYSPREIAAMMEVSYDLVRNWISSGELKAYPLSRAVAGPTGNRYRIYKRDFFTFLLGRNMDPEILDLA